MAMAYDLVVRNGTVIDGSGGPRRRADVAVADGRIAAIGKVDGAGREEIDAEGHIVTPGFVDAHTHMDAQLFWDELGTYSCYHGVTSAVMGNCGFTLAPARPNERALVVRNLERAEDIAAEAMAQGIDWTWATYAEFLDAVEAQRKGINYAGCIGQSALRTWAMGERAFTETATPEDMAVMAEELRSALAAGAVGFTTSRSMSHLTADDRPVASRLASWEEVAELVGIMGRESQGAFEIAAEAHHGDPAGMADYERRLQELCISTGVPMMYGVIGGKNTHLIDDTVAKGGRMYGLTHCRGVSSIYSFHTNIVFDILPEWKEVRRRPLAEQKRLLSDPEVRARLVHAGKHGDYGNRLGPDASKPNFDRLHVMQSTYRRNPTLRQMADERGIDPVELVIDLALETDFEVFFQQFYDSTSDADMMAMLRNPNTAMTFSDAGAHVKSIIDGSIQTHLLAYWVREKQALTLEEAIPMITRKPAELWRLHDRGLLREGLAADITVFDPETVAPAMPYVTSDLPGGASRFMQKAQGYKATVVNGQLFMRDGQPTEARAGQLLRAAHAKPGGQAARRAVAA
jgi:N-acyl-D-amino-acid deacylase